MNESLPRIAVFFDGGNTYFKLRSLRIQRLLSFNYAGLAVWLARDRSIVFRGYYIGTVRAAQKDEHAQRLRRDQQRLFAYLTSREQGFTMKHGYMMKNDGVYHEKGVDVQIAVDLLAGAYENRYDSALLVSSDTDLIPAMEKVRMMGKGVEYVGFSHQPSYAMMRYSTSPRLLIREDLLPFEAKEK
ncbi:MAG: NYN domain-containing protein [Patescibacteria group bacterium]